MSNKINKSKLLFRLLLLIGILSILICLSMCILLDINRNIKFPLQYKLFQILIHNSYNDPIYEIVHTPTQLCNYPYIPLAFDRWEGIRKVCKGKCWYDTDNINHTSFHDFRTDIKIWNYKEYCIKYMDDSMYKLVEKIKRCPRKYKKCGYIDKVTILCTPIKNKCPFNSLKIENTVNDSLNDSFITLENNKTVVFSRENPDGFILNSFKTSEAQPCIDKIYHNRVFSTFRSDLYYNRNKCVTQLRGENEDSTYRMIDSTNYLHLLLENNILRGEGIRDIKNNLLDHHINLYARMGYFGINTLCFKKLNKDKEPLTYFVNNKIIRLRKDILLGRLEGHYTEYIYLLSYLNGVIIIVYMIILCVSDSRKTDNYIMIFFIWSFFIKLLILYIVKNCLILGFEKYHSRIINNPTMKCGDESFNYELEFYMKPIEETSYLLNSCLILNYFSLGIDFIYVIILIIKLYLQRKNLRYLKLKKDDYIENSQVDSETKNTLYIDSKY